jgi:predicted patatin/cPLA2 family phospholipase
VEVEYLDGVIRRQNQIREAILARCELELEQEQRGEHSGERVLDILILSGGGAKGAFGASFLQAWGQVRDPELARPQFDIVTGVSTGSLIAPMAFVGDEESYRLAAETYRNPSPTWVRQRGLLDIVFGEKSIYSDDGLLETIDATVGGRIPQIADAQREHRLLLISAANLNQGLTRIWNMTDAAVDVEHARLTREEFCRRNLSSASIPMAFPPQLIDGNLYVDGSTTADILFFTASDIDEGVLTPWRTRHPGVPFPKIRIWVIANTTLVLPPTEVDERSIAVAARSLGLSVNAGLLAQLKIIELEARLYRDLLGVDCEFRVVALPDEWKGTGGGLFVKEDMVTMSDIGEAMGRDPRSWMTDVPEPLDPSRLRSELESRLHRER